MKIKRFETFYIQRMKWAYDPTKNEEYVTFDNDSRPVDIEKNYNAVYGECKGIDNVGKAKNVYTETYADGNFTRAYLPKKVLRDATNVTLTLYFIGEDRQRNLKRFIDDISGGSLARESRLYGNLYRYYDKIRKRGFDFLYIENTEVQEDNWKGSLPYIKASFKLLNIYGESLTTRTINVENYE